MPTHTRTRFVAGISNLLNVAPDEWEKVGYSWAMKLCFAFGHAIGHTAFLALFATRFGIESLPLFFVGTSLFAIASTVLVTPYLESLRKETLLVGASVVGVVVLTSAYLLDHSFPTATAVLGVVAAGAVMTQLGIVLALFIEEQYSPLESQRTFPIIESAEVVGLLGGGLLVYTLVGRIHAVDLLLVWAVGLAALGLLVGLHRVRSQKVPQLSMRHGHEHVPGLVETVREGFGSVQRVQFLRVMAWTVFVLGAIAKLIEYQYTAALAGAAHGVAEAGAHAEEAHLAHALSLYIVAFSVAALALQLFVSSRLIRRLGVTRTLLLHPAISVLGFAGMLTGVTPATAIGARFGFDLTRGLFIDAYLSSYYAVSHRIRERAKAIIEGWAMPVGAVLGTVLLVIAEELSHDSLPNVITGLLLAGGIVVLALVWRMRSHHTSSTVLALNTGDEQERRTAVEVLGERGHGGSRRHLVRRLTLANETPDMKRKVLETLGRLQDEAAIPAILDRFTDTNLTVKIAAVEALANFPDLGERFEEEAFTRYRLVHALQELFVKEDSARLKLAIMRVFASLRAAEIIPFLLHVLEDGEPEVQADCISVIGSFRDPNIAYFVKPYLASEDVRLKSSAIIALWQFEELRLELLVQIVGMLGRTDRDGMLSTLFLLGELRSRQELTTILGHLESEDPKVRRHAAVALMKLEDDRGIEGLLPVILGHDLMESWKARQMVQRCGRDTRRALRHRLHQEITKRANELLLPVRNDPRKLSRVDLIELIRLYDLAEQHAEVARLRGLLTGAHAAERAEHMRPAVRDGAVA